LRPWQTIRYANYPSIGKFEGALRPARRIAAFSGELIASYPAWRRPIRTWSRQSGEGWTLVGLERLLETVSPEPASRKAAR
jgi:hypothetical protein